MGSTLHERSYTSALTMHRTPSICRSKSLSYFKRLFPMIRTPHPPNTLIQTRHHPAPRPILLPLLLAAGTLQPLRLLEHLMRRHILHTNRALVAIHVRAADDGVVAGAWRDGDFDLGVLFGEGGELSLQEFAADGRLVGLRGWWRGRRTSCLCCCRPSRSSGSRGVCIGG